MKTIKKLFEIIKLFETRKELGVQDIANLLGYNKSTVFRFLKILAEYGFIMRSNENKKYKLGLYFLHLSNIVLENLDIIKQASHHMEELREMIGETVHLAFFNGSQVIYIAKVDSKFPVRMESKIGAIASMHNTGLGKAILAFQGKEMIDKIIEKIHFYPKTINTIVGKNKLLGELEEIRKNNYALDKFEYEDVVSCIAVPIKDYTGQVNYAMSVSAIKSRMTIDQLLEYKGLILEKAYVISKSMGCQE